MNIKTNTPEQNGLYVAYVELFKMQKSKKSSLSRRLLIYFEGDWLHTDKSKKFKGVVYGHTGPLQQYTKEDFRKLGRVEYGIGTAPYVFRAIYGTLSDALATNGYDGDFIFGATPNTTHVAIRKWDTTRQRWLVRRKLRK